MKRNYLYDRVCLGLLAGLLSLGGLRAQEGYKPSQDNLQARETFRNHGFGVFLHWGLYSMYAQGEWYMHNANLHHAEYAKAAGGFYPAKFSAKQWVSAIKASGAGYLTITSRHHDSFSLWDTQYSDYNIVKATPFGRDILAELRDECRRQGIGFHIYYSLLDWTREDYYPLGRTGHGTGRSKHGEWKSYEDFMNNQLSELVGKYDADAIWLDGHWDQDINPNFNWNYPRMYSSIHQLKPSCLIGNNHHDTPIEGEDFQMFERDVPGANTAGLSGQAVSKLPLETCETMNGMWGYKIIDQKYKSVQELIRLLVASAGRNANLLLNVGPQPDGELPAVAVERLATMGKWLETYGSTVKDGVRGGSIPPQEWGVTTQRGKTIYLHILGWQSRMLSIPLKDRVRSVRVFDSKRIVPFTQTKEGLTLTFDEAPSRANPIDFVVEVTLR